MLTHRQLVGIFLIASALLSWPQSAEASCLHPIGPSVTSSDGVTSLNRYANGYHICIHDFAVENSCDNCATGFLHVCLEGYWEPRKAYMCSSAEAAVALDLEREKASAPTSAAPLPGTSARTSDDRQCGSRLSALKHAAESNRPNTAVFEYQWIASNCPDMHADFMNQMPGRKNPPKATSLFSSGLAQSTPRTPARNNSGGGDFGVSSGQVMDMMLMGMQMGLMYNQVRQGTGGYSSPVTVPQGAQASANASGKCPEEYKRELQRQFAANQCGAGGNRANFGCNDVIRMMDACR